MPSVDRLQPVPIDFRLQLEVPRLRRTVNLPPILVRAVSEQELIRVLIVRQHKHSQIDVLRQVIRESFLCRILSRLIAVEQQDDSLRKSLQPIDVSLRQRRPADSNNVRHVELVRDQNIRVTFDDDRCLRLANPFASGVEPEQ